MMRRLSTITLFVIAMSMLALWPHKAFADCTSPAGVESQTIYDFTGHALNVCTGTSWVSLAGSGSPTYTGDLTSGMSISGTYTHGGGGAGGSSALIDNTSTPAADPIGVNTSQYFQIDFGIGNAKHIRRLTVKTAASSGYANSITFNFDWSDNNSTWTTVDVFIIPAGTGTTSVFDFPASGAHRYWRAKYLSGTTGGNAWLEEIEMIEQSSPGGISSQWTDVTGGINYADGNVGIGTAAPDANAILDVSSTTKAMALPRVPAATLAGMSSPIAGLMAYDSTNNVIKVRTNSAWVDLGAGGVSDGDKGDITVSSSGAAWAVDANAITYAKFQQGTARSVLGVTGNATANYAAIQGTANQVLRVDAAGTGLTFGAINLASSAAVTGNLPVANLNSGTSASSSTFWRGDGTWAAPSGADNLGNHTATTTLSLGGNAISGASTVTASSYVSASGGFRVGGSVGATGSINISCNAHSFVGGIGTAFQNNNCGDIAEYYLTEGPVERAEIVALSGNTLSYDATILNPNPDEKKGDPHRVTLSTVQVATASQREKLLGVVATYPSLVSPKKLISDDTPQQPVALAGHVPLRVTLEGGEIAVGDAITISETVTGAGMKALTSGKVVGYALEPYTAATAQERDYVEIYVKLDDWTSPEDRARPSLLAQAMDNLSTKHDAEIQELREEIEALKAAIH